MRTIRLIIRDWWADLRPGNRSTVDHTSMRALRETSRPGMSRQGMGLSARKNTYEQIVEANDRYVESFDEGT